MADVSSLHDPHQKEVAVRHPLDGTPAQTRVAVGSSIAATVGAGHGIGTGSAEVD